MKPSWDDAPRWAKYLAMDSDGTWWWWGDKPTAGDHEWYNLYSSHKFAGRSSWRDTLEDESERVLRSNRAERVGDE